MSPENTSSTASITEVHFELLPQFSSSALQLRTDRDRHRHRWPGQPWPHRQYTVDSHSRSSSTQQSSAWDRELASATSKKINGFDKWIDRDPHAQLFRSHDSRGDMAQLGSRLSDVDGDRAGTES